MAILRKDRKNPAIFSRQVSIGKEPARFDFYDPMAVSKVTETGQKMIRKIVAENPHLFQEKTDSIDD